MPVIFAMKAQLHPLQLMQSLVLNVRKVSIAQRELQREKSAM